MARALPLIVAPAAAKHCFFCARATLIHINWVVDGGRLSQLRAAPAASREIANKLLTHYPRALIELAY
ncbi:MAG: hypothetical protein ACHQRJ_01660 [Alphaproteobacteria bacterium]